VRERIADDQRGGSCVVVDAQLFAGWVEAVDGSVIVQAEALIAHLRGRIARGRSAKAALGTCVRALNRLDARHRFIGTLEAEDLVAALVAEACKGGLEEPEAAELIDRLRDW